MDERSECGLVVAGSLPKGGKAATERLTRFDDLILVDHGRSSRPGEAIVGILFEDCRRSPMILTVQVDP